MTRRHDIPPLTVRTMTVPVLKNLGGKPGGRVGQGSHPGVLSLLPVTAHN